MWLKISVPLTCLSRALLHTGRTPMPHEASSNTSNKRQADSRVCNRWSDPSLLLSGIPWAKGGFGYRSCPLSVIFDGRVCAATLSRPTSEPLLVSLHRSPPSTKYPVPHGATSSCKFSRGRIRAVAVILLSPFNFSFEYPPGPSRFPSPCCLEPTDSLSMMH